MSNNYKFYKKIDHIDSYLIGKNILLDEFTVDTDGVYEGLFYGATADLAKLSYRAKDNQDVEQKIELKLYRSYPYFELNKNCEEVGQIINKKRATGRNTAFCLFETAINASWEGLTKNVCSRGIKFSGKNEVEAYAIIKDWFIRLLKTNLYFS
jgi:hypothetical protein